MTSQFHAFYQTKCYFVTWHILFNYFLLKKKQTRLQHVKWPTPANMEKLQMLYQCVCFKFWIIVNETFHMFDEHTTKKANTLRQVGTCTCNDFILALNHNFHSNNSIIIFKMQATIYMSMMRLILLVIISRFTVPGCDKNFVSLKNSISTWIACIISVTTFDLGDWHNGTLLTRGIKCLDESLFIINDIDIPLWKIGAWKCSKYYQNHKKTTVWPRYDR